MLNGTLTLHDVKDIEAHTATIITRNQPANLTPQDHEDLHAWLITEAWKLSRDYRPGTSSFSAYSTRRLTLRIIDWQRKHHGRTRWTFGDTPQIRRNNKGYLNTTIERPKRPHDISLDDPLGQTIPTSLVDNHEHSDPDLQRLLTHRDRQSDKPYPRRSRTPTRRAAA